MKIFIPSHLRTLTVVDQLAKMVTAYSESKSANSSIEETTDPVKKFVKMVIKPENCPQNYADVIDYITAVFYTVKGTFKVIEYMKMYLGFSDDSIVYSPESISIGETGETDNDNLYISALKGFLNELLYFGETKTDAATGNLKIETTVTAKVLASNDIHKYKVIKPTIED